MGVEGYEVLRDGQRVAEVRGRQASDPGLRAARKYCYSVVAFDLAGNRSSPSAPACVVVADKTPPTAPANLAAEIRGNVIALRWAPAQDDVGVVAYEVIRDGAVLSRVNGIRTSNEGLYAGVKYCYAVRALDAAGNRSEPSSPPVCATLPDTTPPTVPSDLAVRAESDSAIAVTWRAATDDVGVARYDVVEQYRVVATVQSLSTTFRDLRPASEHCFAVRACDAAANCSNASPYVCATTPDVTAPAQVTNVTAVAASDRLVTVRWAATHDDVGVASYEVRRNERTIATVEGTVISADDAGLSPARKYCYTVFARDAAGNVSTASRAACTVTPDLTPPSTPDGVAVGPRSSTQIGITWRPAADDVGVVSYEVLRDGKVVARAADTDALISELSPETEYCFTVRALDAAGNRSEASKPACGRTADPRAPAAPWNLRAETTRRKELLLAWDPSPDPNVEYIVFWDGNGEGERPIGTTPASTFKVFGYAAYKKHCYRVAARRGGGTDESPRTFPVCASTAPRTAPARTAAAEAGTGGN